MSDEIHRQLQTWRDNFDQAFAEPRRQGDDEATLDVLGIRIAGEPFALNLADLAGLLPAMTPAAYPATAPGLLGLIGHQGQVLPLYDLQTLTGRGTSPMAHWCVIARAAPLALAFEGFDGQWRLAAGDRLQQNDAAATSWAVRCGGALRPLIDLDALIAGVAEAVGDPEAIAPASITNNTAVAPATGP